MPFSISYFFEDKITRVVGIENSLNLQGILKGNYDAIDDNSRPFVFLKDSEDLELIKHTYAFLMYANGKFTLQDFKGVENYYDHLLIKNNIQPINKYVS